MTIEELEAECTRLRGRVVELDDRIANLTTKEAELTRRNVSLYERLRYVEHQARGIRDAITGLLENGVDHQ